MALLVNEETGDLGVFQPAGRGTSERIVTVRYCADETIRVNCDNALRRGATYGPASFYLDRERAEQLLLALDLALSDGR